MGQKTAINEAQVRALIKRAVELYKETSKHYGEVSKERAAARQQRVEQLIQPIDMQIQSFLHGWEIQAVAALSVASMPPEEDSQIFWFIALGGNMLWAATCMINPVAGVGLKIGAKMSAETAALLTKVMSFSGAFAGSGGIQFGYEKIEKIWKDPPGSVEDAKSLAASYVVEKRDLLELIFKTKRREWANALADVGNWGETTEQIIDMHQQYIWDQMFPRIPYDGGDHKYTRILNLCVENMKAMLADYKVNWKSYQQMASWYGAAERKRRGIYFKYNPKLRFDLGTADTGKAETLIFE